MWTSKSGNSELLLCMGRKEQEIVETHCGKCLHH